QYGCHRRKVVGKDVQIDVRAAADVTRQHAADEPRAEARELAHEAEGVEPHGAEVGVTGGAFVHAGHGFDLIANLGVGGAVAGAMARGDDEVGGGVAVGGEVLLFLSGVHHAGRQRGDLTTNANI